MTLETAKRMYNYFVSKGMKKEAEEIAKKRPAVLPKKVEKKVEKSKGK